MDVQTPDRITWPDSDLFSRSYVIPGRPVIISGGLGQCKATSWTVDHLTSVVGQKRLKVAVSHNRGVFGYKTDGAAYAVEDMTFADAVRLMQTSVDPKYYIMQTPVREQLPELAPDIVPPAVIEPNDLSVVNFWLSAAGDVTPLHFDLENNFLAQICGEKVVTLFSPDDSRYLYALPPEGQFAHVSQVDFLKPDLDRFPLFSEAQRIRATLEPGDVLYLPPFWWHAVESVSMSVSLNFWWRIKAPQFFVPIMLDRLVGMFDRTRLRSIAVNRGGLISIAEEALNKRGYYWVASLFAAAALEQYLRRALSRCNVPIERIPARLDALNSELRIVGSELAIETDRIREWMAIVRRARSADDNHLDRASVLRMVTEIRRTILRSVLPKVT